MMPARHIALTSANKIIADLQETAHDLESALTLATFATTGHAPIYDHQPVSHIAPLSQAGYHPDGRTALYDAVGHTVERLQAHPDAEDEAARFAVYVVTDGRENNSVHYNREDIHALIRDLESTGRWEFYFYGAFSDAREVGDELGFHPGRSKGFAHSPRGRHDSMRELRKDIRDDISKRRADARPLAVREAIPDMARLLDAVEERNTNKGSHCHGQRHWRGVAWTAHELLRETPGADPAVALLFAVFHDSQRRHDGGDRHHGQRGANLAREMHGTYFHLSRRQMDQLEDACARHNGGVLPLDTTVALCWDSDRLNLWRVRTVPNPARLCLPASRRPERIEWARSLKQEEHTWEEIYQAFVGCAPQRAHRMPVP